LRHFFTACFLSLLLAATASPQSMSETEARVRGWACEVEDLDAASKRLAELRAADQEARTGGMWTNDMPRRVEVAEIYAKGCLQRGADFHHAALIFQHGNSPEHYYQAWYFASRAVELGEDDAQWIIPRAIDRYLMNKGQKQLFGTNTVTPHFIGIETEQAYFCLWPVEDSFPDDVRARYGIPPLSEKRRRVKAELPDNVGFDGAECSIDVPSPPNDIFPGIW